MKRGKNPTKPLSSDEKDKFSKTVTDAQSRYERKSAPKIRLAQWISTVDSISKPSYSSLSPPTLSFPSFQSPPSPQLSSWQGSGAVSAGSHKPLCWGQWSQCWCRHLAWDSFPLHMVGDTCFELTFRLHLGQFLSSCNWKGLGWHVGKISLCERWEMSSFYQRKTNSCRVMFWCIFSQSAPPMPTQVSSSSSWKCLKKKEINLLEGLLTSWP